LYEAEIKPLEKKIIWYNFKQEIPNLPATKKIGNTKDPQGKVVAPQIVIATSKDAKSKQFIWQPTVQKTIEKEIKAPNVVAVKAAASPPPPPPQPVVTETPPDAPKVDAPKVEAGVALVKIPPRRYEPTPQARPQIPIPVQQQITDAPPSASVLGGAAALPDIQTNTLGQLKIPPKRYVPPNASKSDANGVASAKTGIIAPAPELANTGSVNMAIVGLNPSNLPPPAIPAGSLPGQFSTAPKAGKASTGNLPTSAAGVPNLVVEGGKGVRNGMAPPSIPDTRKTVSYRQVASGPMPSTLSAPLRPGTRTIPGALESRFQGINVYTLVLPGPNLPGYAGDWVLWFADRQATEGTVQMRAPMPLRKKISDQASAPAASSVTRVQVAGTMGKDGRLAQMSILKGNPGMTNAVLEDLKAWEFTPATRNLVAVDVEVVIEIPYRLEVRAER